MASARELCGARVEHMWVEYKIFYIHKVGFGI